MLLYAVATPGLETALGGEVADLTGVPVPVASPVGGIEFPGDEQLLYRANLLLATATRVLVRVGEVRARDFARLRRDVARLPWEQFARGPVRITAAVTTHHCRLHHTGAIAERIAWAMSDRFGPAGEGAPSMHLVVRGEDDGFTLSVDSSGEPLYRRGYRTEVGRAPLRETLAAGLLFLAGWAPGEPLWDPMCGSGTIVLEAARRAAGRAPGAHRPFAFQAWPLFRADLWRQVVARAEPPASAPALASAPLGGSDADPTAILRAGRNAQRTGLSEAVSFACAGAENAPLPFSPGLMACNLPYGKRIPRDLAERALKALARCVRQAPRWRLAVLAPPRFNLGAAFGRTPTATHELQNGGIWVRLSLFSPRRA